MRGDNSEEEEKTIVKMENGKKKRRTGEVEIVNKEEIDDDVAITIFNEVSTPITDAGVVKKDCELVPVVPEAAATNEASSPVLMDATIPDNDGDEKMNKPKKKKAKTITKKKKVSIQPLKREGDDEQGDECQESVLEEQEEEEDDDDDDDKLYCICKARFYEDEVRSMLACDNCDEWYHAFCMKLDEDQVKFVDQFICSLCEPNTNQRTTMKQPCSRTGCDGIAPWPLSKYCSQECGILVATSRFSRIKPIKGVSIQKTAIKLLQAPGIMSSKKIEGKVVWTTGQNKRKWLESIMGHEVLQSGIDDVTKLQDMAEVEELTRLIKRHKQVEEKRSAVNLELDALNSRTTLLQLVDERVGSLDLIGDEEGMENRVTVKKSKSKKGIKQEEFINEKHVMRGQGQPRCGYDERLSWNDERFRSWYRTEEAKLMMDGKLALDGSLFIDGEEVETQTIKICGQSKRKCKKHGDWSVIRGADMEAEKEMQNTQLTELDDEDQVLSKKIEELKITIRGKLAKQDDNEKEQDMLLAKQLANQGRRTIHVL